MRVRTFSLRSCYADIRGATLIEFALVLPAFLMLIIGGFNVAIAMFKASNMQFAAEAAARCASVKTTVCTNNTTTAAYAKNRVTSNATFVASSASCGHLVTGTLNYQMNIAVKTITIPLTAKACFP